MTNRKTKKKTKQQKKPNFPFFNDPFTTLFS